MKVLMVSVEVKHHAYYLCPRAQELCESPYGLCGREATLEEDRAKKKKKKKKKKALMISNWARFGDCLLNFYRDNTCSDSDSDLLIVFR